MSAFDPTVAARIAESQIPMSADYVQAAGLSAEGEAEIRAIAARAAAEPFFVSDCEGELQVWREAALTHVRRDETGTITMYSFPSSYRSTDEVIRIDLDSWDPGEDATDDKRREDINDLVDARQSVAALLAELDRERARSERIKQRLLLGGGEWCKRALEAEAELDRISADVQGLALGDIKPGGDAS